MIDSIALIVILSFLIPVATVKLFKGIIPSVAFEILTGFIIGKSGLNLIDPNSEILSFLSLFGLAFLMFLGGLESDIDIKKHISKDFLRSPLFIAILIFILTLILSWVFSYMLIELFNCSKSVFYLTLIFSTTSVAIVFPTLKSREDLKLAYKQTILYSAFIADFLTLIAITIFSMYKEKNTVTSEILLIFLIFGIAIVTNRFIKKLPSQSKIVEALNLLRHKSHIQIGIRGSFAILLLFMFLAEKLGIEVILGSFIAGLIISNIDIKESRLMRMKLDAIGYGFFIPIFFIYQGATSNLPMSFSSLEFLVLTVVGGILIKVIASMPLGLRFSFKDTLAGGILLSGRLSLIIAAGIIGLKLGIVDEDINAAIIVLAATTCILTPVLFNMIKQPKRQKNLL